MIDLIGKRFKRDKYGLSLWEDKIKEVSYVLKLVNPPKEKAHTFKELFKRQREAEKFGHKVMIKVTGYKTFCWYDIDEIIVFL